MKVVEYNNYGNSDVLQIVEREKPEPKDNELLIKIKATSVSQVDSIFRKGNQFFARLATGITKPKNRVLGFEFSGVVEKVGNKVDNFNVGDEVFGVTNDGIGTHSEYVILPDDAVILKKPSNLSFINAAGLSAGALTALPFLRDAGNIKSGNKILIIGASGSIGTFAVQLAKYFGTEVTGVCSTKNIEMVKQLGADFVIDYTKEDYRNKQNYYDIIFDTIGKSSFSTCKELLVSNGKFITTFISFRILFNMLLTNTFTRKGKTAKIIFTGMRKNHDKLSDLKFVLDLVVAGKLQVIVDNVYPLEKIKDAHAYVDKGHKIGNVIITME